MPSFETPEPITATIDVVGGDIHVGTSDDKATLVDVQPADAANEEDRKAAELTRVEYADGRLLVKTPKVRSWRPRSTGGAVVVRVELPTGSNVHGAGQLADFECEGRLAECRIKTGFGQLRVGEAGTVSLKTGIGDITVDHATGHAELTAASGDVRARQLDSSAVIKNSNGDSWVGAAGGDLRVNAANGSISVDLANASVVAKSANGDVRLGEVVRGSVVLETTLGDLEIGIREGTSAWLDARAKAGRLHNALEAAEAPGASDRDRRGARPHHGRQRGGAAAMSDYEYARRPRCRGPTP